MFDRNRSGQVLYFSLVSALSGNPVTGQVTGISGRASIDGGAQAVIAGTLGETGGGQYQANLYAADVDGNNLGFLFTASGCVPVSFTVVTQQNVSGRIFAASGGNAIVPIASISGVNPASGAFVAVPPATLSGVIANSGLFVTVPKATISGVIANSGLFVTVPIETISGVIPASGSFVTVLKATISGVIANSGLFVIATAGSGLFVTVPIESISGVIPASGAFVTVPKETISGVVANSGLFVTATATVASGTVFLASGSAVNLLSGNVTSPYSGSLSGQIVSTFSGTTVLPSGGNVGILSGQFVNVYSGQLSGQPIAGLSGRIYPASGIWPASGANAVVPPETLSGVVANSGLFVTANLLSGNIVGVYSGNLSGQQVTARTVTDKSGYILSNSGLDLVNVETGMNFRQAQSVIAAAAGGQLSGAGTATINIDGANVSGTTRITANVNASGNRTAITLNLPG